MAPSNKPFKAPLTHQDLRDIGLRNRDHADVTALLWEIKRLRAIALRADQVCRTLEGANIGGASGIILQAMRSQLEHEPCVLESNQLREEMLNPHAQGDED